MDKYHITLVDESEKEMSGDSIVWEVGFKQNGMLIEEKHCFDAIDTTRDWVYVIDYKDITGITTAERSNEKEFKSIDYWMGEGDYAVLMHTSGDDGIIGFLYWSEEERNGQKAYIEKAIREKAED